MGERVDTLIAPALRWTIKRKLLALGAATLLPVLVFFTLWTRWQVRIHTEEAEAELALGSTQAAAQVEQLLEQIVGHLEFHARAATVQRRQVEEIQADLAHFMAQHSELENLVAASADGLPFASVVRVPAGMAVSLADRPWFRQVMATGRPAVSGFLSGTITGRPAVIVAAPLRGGEGPPTGALIAALGLGRLSLLFRALPLGRGMTVTVADGEGRVLSHHPEAEGWIGRSLPAVAALPSRRALKRLAWPEGGEALAAVTPVGEIGWKVAVGVPAAALQRRIWQEASSIVLPVLAVLALSSLVGLLIARRTWRPLQALTEAVAQFPEGVRISVDVRSTDEAGQLARAFSAMAGQIEESRWRLERQLAELTALSEAGRLLTSTLEISEVLSRFADLVSGRLGVDVVRIWLLDQASGEVHLRAQSGATQGREYSRRIPRGQGLVGWIIERREPVVLSDLRTDPRLIDRRWLEEEEFVSYLGVPIVLEDLTVGGLVCLSRRPRDFSAEDMALALTFAVPAAVAIRNARLYGEARASALDLAARSHRLELLYETARAMTAELDIERLLERIVEHARRMLGARYGALLVSSDDRRVSALFTAGLTPEERERMGSPPEGRGLLGHVIEHGALRLDDLSAHPAVAGFPPGHPPMRSLLAVPIRHRERVLGALYLTEKPGGFAAEDAALLTTMAADAAVAIENASLVKRLRDALDDLKKAQGRLVETEALRAVGEVAAGVAHHLNNALTVIRGRAELAMQTVEDPRLRSTLGVVERTAVNGAKILHRLQEMTSVPPAWPGARVDLTEVTRAALERSEPRWRDRLGARDISIEVSAEAGPLPPVAGDRVALEEVMGSLLLNAVEATPEGGRITVRLWASRGSVHCAVSDSGAGMSEEERRRALEPFFTTKGPRRAGLGLSVSHGIVQRHGGSLNIESAPGLGTTVTISLPAAAAQAGPEERPGEGAG